MDTSWHSYPSVFALGHHALAELLIDPVLVEEKIDGSQFSMGLFDGQLRAKSKGKELIIDEPEKMFARAVEVARALPLHDGWTYRCEYLQKPKHNSLAYDRTPRMHLIVFDINIGHESYMPYEAKADECARLGLEVVPRLREGMITQPEELRALLETVSILGGQKVEGIVIKNYARFAPDKKVLMGKFVSEAFKEVHAREWKNTNPTKGDVIERLISLYKTPSRWNKAIQHLRERGELEDSPRDIGKLIKEVPEDVLKECRDEIAQALFDYAWPQIRRGINGGLPEWYKQQLLDRQFNAPENG